MTALAIGTTALVLLLALLVVGLLRSYATVLQRLEELGSGPAPAGGARLDPSLPLPSDRPADIRGRTITGVGLSGEPLQVSVTEGTQNTLLAFLTSGCTTCRHFWHALDPSNGELPVDARVVAVTKDPHFESPSRLLELGAGRVAVIQSSAAWEDYAVPGSPYFVYIDGATGSVTGEGSALAWDQVQSLLRDAVLDSALQSSSPDGEGRAAATAPRGETAPHRAARAERAFVDAKIPFDDPSFFDLSRHEADSLRD